MIEGLNLSLPVYLWEALQALEELHGQPSLDRRPVEVEEDTDEDYYQEAHIEIRIYLIHTM